MVLGDIVEPPPIWIWRHCQSFNRENHARSREGHPFHLVLANVQRIVASVDIPVTVDLEGGYGQSPLEVRENAIKIMESGAVGINFEDQIVGGRELYSIKDQCPRVKAIRDASVYASIPLFINARTDIFLKPDATTHSDVHVDEAIDRALAYAEAGASGFFVSGLKRRRVH